MSIAKQIARIIPPHYRRRGLLVALTILVRALLNFFGIALLVPLMMLIIEGKALERYEILRQIYGWLGCQSEREFIWLMASAVVGAILLKNVINLLLYKLERDYIYGIYHNLARRLFVDYYRRGFGFAQQNNSAELSRNVNFVCLNFAAGVLRPIAAIASESILLLLVLLAAGAYNLKAALLLGVLTTVALWLYYSLVRKRLRAYGKEENAAHREMFRGVAESFRGYADVEINNAFPQMLAQFDGAIERLITMRKKDAMLSATPQSITEIAVALGMAALVVVASYSQAAEVGIVFGFFAVAALWLMPSLRRVLSGVTALRYNLYTLQTLSHIDSCQYETTIEQSRLSLKQSIELRDVSFAYTDNEQIITPANPASEKSDSKEYFAQDTSPDELSQEGRGGVIENLSLKITRGEGVGICGSSGAGKSTLMSLMLGLHSPQKGEILIDGEPLDGEIKRKWQNSVGYVAQSVFILDSTLKENVALGVESDKIDEQRVIRSLEMASMGEFLKTLPDGINTRIGEMGSRISGGERQRIGIARALYREPEVLFFDEATSALDSITEESVNRSIATLSEQNKELTIVVIAHRKSSLEYCDRIIEISKQ